MSKIQTIQTSFGYGELSPRLLAHVDLDQYKSGCKTMENAYPLLHGAAQRRQGTHFVGEVFDSSEPALFLKFVFSKDVAYQVVINGGRIEFIANREFVESSPGVRYYISSPYSASELSEIRYAQVGTKIYIVHPNHPPKVLETYGATLWTLTNVVFEYNAITDYWYDNSQLRFKILGGTKNFEVGDVFTFNHPSTTASSSPSTNSLYGIAYSGSRYVAVGQQGIILTSTTGDVWTRRTSGTTNHLYCVIWDGSQFIAAGQNGKFYTSESGYDWTEYALGGTYDILSICWTGSLYVAVGGNGLIKTSSNLTSWTTQSSGTVEGLNKVIHNGTVFVACGNNGTILTSTNGATWTTKVPTPAIAWLSHLYDIIHWNDMTLVVGANGVIITSYDNGTTFTTTDVLYTMQDIRSVSADNNNIIFAGTSGVQFTGTATGIALYSVSVGSSTTTQHLRACIVTPGRYVAVGNGATILTSTDNIKWSQVNNSTTTGNGKVFGIEYKSGAVSQTWTLTCISADENRQEWQVSGSVSGEITTTWKTGNYPSTVVAYEQRLYFGGTNNEPQTIWGSVVGQYENLTLGANDSDGVQFAVASNQYDKIIHLVSGRHLLLFTQGSEYTMVGGQSGVTPSAINITQHTQHGSNDTVPFRIGQEVLFVQRGGGKTRAVSYSVAEDINLAPDVTFFSDHISNTPASNGFTSATFAQDPDYVAWLTRADGVLTSVTHIRDFNTTGWSRHTTDGLFETVSSIPNGSVDDVYFVVLREVDGTAVRYVECFNYSNPVNTDSTIILTQDPASDTWTGLDHLEGKAVDIIADGHVHPQRTVTSGQITLEYTASTVEVGLHYDTKIELSHPQIVLADGTTQGRMLSVNEVILRLENTTGVTVNGTSIGNRHFGDIFGEPVPPYTGDINVTTNGWSTNSSMVIEQKVPRPFTLLGVILSVNT